MTMNWFPCSGMRPHFCGAWDGALMQEDAYSDRPAYVTRPFTEVFVEEENNPLVCQVLMVRPLIPRPHENTEEMITRLPSSIWPLAQIVCELPDR